MRIDKIFPTSIGLSHCENHQSLKQCFAKSAMKHVDSSGYTGEGYGYMHLQQDVTLEPIFQYVCDNVKEYLFEHGIDKDRFSVNVMKCWMQVILNGDTMPHIHSESHYSFVYYVNIPKSDRARKQLVLHNTHSGLNRTSPNEPFAGMFSNNTSIENDINCYTKKYDVNEGDLIIFPSFIRHSTETNGVYNGERKEMPSKNINDLMSKRVCIAGDIILTYAKKEPRFVGLQPTETWRAF